MKRQFYAAAMEAKRKRAAWKSSGKRFPLTRTPMLRDMLRAKMRYSSHSREIKYVDIAETTITVRSAATPPVLTCLNYPVQGAAPYNRIGSKIMNKSIHIVGYVENAATTSSDFMRILVVYDRQTNGSAPSWATLIQSTTSAGAQASTALDGINMDNRERFKVLADDKIVLASLTNTAGVFTNVWNPDSSGAKGSSRYNYNRFIRLAGLETHFKASAGGVGDIATGGIFIVCATDSNDSKWYFNYTARLRYDDM